MSVRNFFSIILSLVCVSMINPLGYAEEIQVEGSKYVSLGDGGFYEAKGHSGLLLDGKLGIGTTSPGKTLSLKVGGADGIEIADNSSGRRLGFFVDSTSDSNIELYDRSNNMKVMVDSNGDSFFNGGKVGIGTTTPDRNLTISSGTNRLAGMHLNAAGYQGNSGSAYSFIGLSTPTYKDQASSEGFELGLEDSSGLVYFSRHQNAGAGGAKQFVLDKNGNVGIGTTDPSAKLAVNGDGKFNGTLYANKIRVTANFWPDYVFANNYTLMSLNQIEKHIQENKHLPGLPSAKEVESNGVDMGEMQKKLVEKIEELTLHMINQEKRIKAQEQEMQRVRRDLSKVAA